MSGPAHSGASELGAEVPGCGGLAIDVDDLWRELDAAIAESDEG